MGEINNIDHLSPVETEIRTELGNTTSALVVFKCSYWSSSIWSSFLFAQCHNIHGIAPHGARHVIETAAHASISSSAVVKEGSLED